MSACDFKNSFDANYINIYFKYKINRAGMCEAARAKGRGYASEKAGFGNPHFQSGTDLVGGVDNEVGVVATFPDRLRSLRVVCGLCVLFPFS